MATRVFYTDVVSPLDAFNPGGLGFKVRSGSLTRGTGVVTKTRDSAASAPLVILDSGTSGTTPRLVFAIQVNAFSATTGNYTWNHWGSETNAMANFTAAHTNDIEVYDSAGALRFTLLATGGAWTTATEYGTSPAARTPTAAKAGTARTINDGDYLLFKPDHATVGSPAATHSLTFSYNGTSAAADGDSYMDCPDTFTEFVPAVFTPYRNPMPPLIAQ